MAIQKIFLLRRETKPWLIAAGMLEANLSSELIESVDNLVGVKGIELFVSFNVPLEFVNEMPGMPGKFFVSSLYIAEKIGLHEEKVEMFRDLVNKISHLYAQMVKENRIGFELALIVNESGHNLMVRDLIAEPPKVKDFLH